jgi:hypothetical protein
MIIEALTFKLALDFGKYLRKNRIYLGDVKLDFFDRTVHEYRDFSDLSAMQEFYDQRYVPIDNCRLGSLVGIQFFRSTSDTYDFPTSYKAVDVLGNVTVSPGAGFDIQRDPGREILKERQRAFVDKSIREYIKFYSELRYIYVTGIYSPCYAEPGWSENTWWLRSLRDTLVGSTDRSAFPYTNTVIQTSPPSA